MRWWQYGFLVVGTLATIAAIGWGIPACHDYQERKDAERRRAMPCTEGIFDVDFQPSCWHPQHYIAERFVAEDDVFIVCKCRDPLPIASCMQTVFGYGDIPSPHPGEQ